VSSPSNTLYQSPSHSTKKNANAKKSAESHEQRTILAGQIARALAVFSVDEVVVFNDGDASLPKPNHQREDYTGTSDPDHFLVHLLSYLEAPPHLRKHLFPLHPNLKTAGSLPALDLPSHLQRNEWCPYREGVTIACEGGQTVIEAGLNIPVTVDAEIPPSARVTLKFDPAAEVQMKDSNTKVIKAEAVNPSEPKEESGYYWGYTVRRADNLSAVFTESTYDGGYDLTVGTSERGKALESLYGADENGESLGKFNHLLVVFGGETGLEVAVKNDAQLSGLGVTDAKEVFDQWVDLCPGQGSRSIRTEEALWMGLMGLRRLVVNNDR
jgi:predicted SPOUT superfamily RNA methylase MTH1